MQVRDMTLRLFILKGISRNLLFFFSLSTHLSTASDDPDHRLTEIIEVCDRVCAYDTVAYDLIGEITLILFYYFPRCANI